LLAHGRWFSPGTPASSTTKTDPHDIAEILLKVALNTIKQTIFLLEKQHAFICLLVLICGLEIVVLLCNNTLQLQFIMYLI